MSITSRPATAIIIALAAFLIVSLALACSSAPAQGTAAPPAAPPAGRVSAAAPSQLITPVVVLPIPTAIPQCQFSWSLGRRFSRTSSHPGSAVN